MDVLFNFEHPFLLLFIVLASYPLYKTYAQIFFGDNFEKLSLAFHYLLQRDWVSFKKGEYWDDKHNSHKIYYFIGICILWDLSVYEGLCRLFFE